MKRMITRGLFAVAVAASLVFGAAQAAAAPAGKAVAGCTPESCAKRCAPLTGFCDGRGCWCR